MTGLTVTDGGKLWELLSRVRTVTWKPASRRWVRIVGPRLPVAYVKSESQCLYKGIVGERRVQLKGLLKYFGSYPCQCDFGDSTHIVGNFYASSVIGCYKCKISRSPSKRP